MAMAMPPQRWRTASAAWGVAGCGGGERVGKVPRGGGATSG
jgi:hypothetical protein